MPYRISLSLLGIIIVGSLSFAAESAAVIPGIATPTIDGVIATSEWHTSSRLEPFVDNVDAGRHVALTEVLLGHDDEALYLAFRCHEPLMDRLVAANVERDGALWNDDCVEIFLDVDSDRSTYVHLIANANGAQYDALGEDPTWNCSWSAAAKREDNAWTVEVAIPFQELGVEDIESGEVWLANFCRERKPVDELSCWSKTKGSFAAPGAFCELIFDSFSAKLENDAVSLIAEIDALAARTKSAGPSLGELRNRAEEFKGSAESIRISPDYLVAKQQFDLIRRHLVKLKGLLLQEEMSGKPYVIWQANPWDVFSQKVPLGALGEKVSSATAALLQNDAADIGFMITNLTDQTFSARVLLEWLDDMHVREPVEMYRAEFVRAADGRAVPDALVPLDEASSITVPAGETRQAWLRFRSRDLEPGMYHGVLHFYPLLLSEDITDVTVAFEVFPVSLPEKRREQVLTWDYLGDARKVGLEREYHNALADNGVNVFMLSGLRLVPRVDVDGEGNFKEPLDFSSFREAAELKTSRGGTLYLTMDIWEKKSVRRAYGQPYYSEPWKKAFKETLRRTISELESLGLGYDDFIINPVDESCDERYIDIAKLVRETDPQVRLLADTHTTDATAYQAVSPYVDIWCTHFTYLSMERCKEFFEWVREDGKPMWSYYYSEGANEKARAPHEYRWKHWYVFNRALGGLCYWTATQHYGDAWHRYRIKAHYDPSLIYPGRSCVIPSRRWFAFHRGILDFARLDLLRDTLELAEGEGVPAEMILEGRTLLAQTQDDVLADNTNSSLPDIYSDKINRFLVRLNQAGQASVP